MKKMTLRQIQRDDSILMNMYSDFVVIDQETVEQKQIESRRELAVKLIEYIENHISALEQQVDGNDVIDRFMYITDRILFWKNLLLHQFRVFYDSKIISVPQFLGEESDKERKSHNNDVEQD